MTLAHHTCACSSPNTCPFSPHGDGVVLVGVGWFELDESKNTNVYVTGLPFDITEEEYTELMSKYGIIKEDDNGVCVCVRVRVVCVCVCVCVCMCVSVYGVCECVWCVCGVCVWCVCVVCMCARACMCARVCARVCVVCMCVCVCSSGQRHYLLYCSSAHTHTLMTNVVLCYDTHPLMSLVWSLVYVGQLKLKLYRDENGELKGDGRCCYLKVGGWEGMGGAAISRWVGGDGRCCYLKVGGRGWEGMLPQGGWEGMGSAGTALS